LTRPVSPEQTRRTNRNPCQRPPTSRHSQGRSRPRCHSTSQTLCPRRVAGYPRATKPRWPRKPAESSFQSSKLSLLKNRGSIDNSTNALDEHSPRLVLRVQSHAEKQRRQEREDICLQESHEELKQA